MPRAASAFSISSTETHLAGVAAGRPGSASRSFCLQVDLGLEQLGLGPLEHAPCREASMAFSSLCSRTASTSPFLTFEPSSTNIRSTRPGILAPIIAWWRDLR